MKRVTIRHPRISLLLYKNVGRTTINGSVPVSERFSSGQAKNIDLARFLGDQGRVTVQKSTRDAAGAFQLVLTDQISIDGEDSLYGLVEPQDLIEIRMAGDAYKYPYKLPIMMRGFVCGVERTEAMSQGGKPQRRVIIDGLDYGKLWQTYQFFILPNSPDVVGLVTSFNIFNQFGLDFKALPVGEFVRQVIDGSKSLNAYIENMGGLQGGARSELKKLKTDISVNSGVVAPNGIGPWNSGTIYDLFRQYCDVGPWNELFIEDREDAPYVVFRPNPFIRADRSGYVQAQSKPPTFTKVSREDVVSLSQRRSDNDVANYYWVDAPIATLQHDITVKLGALQGQLGSTYLNYGNVNPNLYGPRKMSAATQLAGDGQVTSGNGTPAGAQQSNDSNAYFNWMDLRRSQLIEQNKDNIVFESGTMRLKGNEKIRAGSYVRMTHGNMESDYYAVSVQHDYQVFQSYTTTVNFERGTGFIDRIQRGGSRSGPYRAGPYYSELADN